MPMILDDSPTSSPPSEPITSKIQTKTQHSLPPQSNTLSQRHNEGYTLRTTHHTADALIVGAGVFGCSLAVTLARRGHSVILLEKSLKEPDRIVGELLQPGGVEALTKLGLRDCLDGIDAIPVKGYDVIYYGRGVAIPYPMQATSAGIGTRADTKGAGKSKTGLVNGTALKVEEEAEAEPLRPQGRSFHHGRFIAALRRACVREPNISLIEGTATEPISSNYCQGNVLGTKATTANSKDDFFFAPMTFIADGYASTFRKLYHPHSSASKSKFYGMELKDCVLPSPQHGHVVLGDAPPVLLYQIGTHETRVLADIPAGLESASVKNGGAKGHLQHAVYPNLPESVKPSFQAALDEGKLRSMPNSWLPPTTQGQGVKGLVLLGDAMNMRHPLTGGGMTVALNDVLLIRTLLDEAHVKDLGEEKKMADMWKRFHWRRKGLTSVINVLAMALYSLFAADGRICIRTLVNTMLMILSRPVPSCPSARLLHLLPARWQMCR